MIPLIWTNNLEDEDWSFIKRFILASGSLKEMANQYDVSYPTVRLKLDRIIQKINITDHSEEDSFIEMIKRFAINDKLDYDIAKTIINEYREKKGSI